MSAVVGAGLLVPEVNHAQTRYLTAITVTPADPTIGMGQTEAFSGEGTFNDGSTQLLSADGGAWVPSGSLTTPRFYHTATLLQDGSVLVAGGYNFSSNFASAERYDPETGNWAPAGSMALARNSHTATLLPNGKVLVVGGIRYVGSSGTLTNTTELYDPATNSWSAGPPLTLGVRSSHSAVLLGTGKVLVTAGLLSYPDCTYRPTSELYSPVLNTWTATGSLSLRRSSATATLLGNGKVLLAGGPQNGCPTPNNGLNEAEVYDPATGAWTVTGTLSLPRYNNSITLLPSGKVLLAGGYTASGTIATADLFDPDTGSFSLTGSLATARATTGGAGDNGVSPLLQNGQVLFAGGYTSAGPIVGNTELYDPASGAWTTTGSLATARAFNTATLLADGHVLVVGGYTNGGIPLGSTELYLPRVIWTSSNESVAMIAQTGVATGLSAGTTTIALTSGGITGSTTLTVAVDIEPPTTHATFPLPNSNGWNRFNVDVTLDAFDPGGAVPASGVQSITYGLSGAQSGGGTFNTASTVFTISNEGTTTVTYYATDANGNVEPTQTFTINLDKTPPTLSALPNITVNATSAAGAVVTFSPTALDLLSGIDTVAITQGLPSAATFPHGTTNEQVTATDKAGNTAAGTFSVTVNKILVSIGVTPPSATLTAAQSNQQFTATGTYSDGSTQPLSAGGGAWAPSGSLATPRFYHTATLLPDGSVLIVGGHNASGSLASAERYFPGTHTWVPAGTMSSPRAAHTATLLPNGRVLVVGGMNFSTNVLTNTTQLYDPATNSWSAGPNLLNGVRAFHSAVLLNTGKVLVVAGLSGPTDCTYRATAELYTPGTPGSWAATGSLHLARSNASTVLLTSGQVLLAGGPANNCPTPNLGLNQAETYDPGTGLWTVTTGNTNGSRYNNFISPLPNGNALLAGGVSNNVLQTFVATADVYNPVSRTFNGSGSMATPRGSSGGTGDNGTTVVLQNGDVLVAGGITTGGGILSSAELYTTTTGLWTPTGSMATARTLNTTTLLQDGTVLVVGGQGSGGPALGSAELYAPPGLSWSSSNGSVASINQSGLATALASGATTISASSGGISGSASLTVDKAAPTTTATPSPAPNGAGWNKADVTVTLQATDDAGGTGVQSITYSLSGAQTGGGTFNGASTFFSILNEGITTVTYHATDVSGNVEADHTLIVRLDKTAPSAANLSSVTVPATSTFGAVVSFNPLASDGLSGIDSVVATPLTSGSTFPHGTTNETVTVTDVAGNTTIRNFSVTVTKTLMSIAVTPANASVHPTLNQQFTATGTFTDSSTEVLPSAGSGGGSGGGNSGQGSPMWEIHATSGMEFASCSTPQYPLLPGNSAFVSQNFFDRNGVVHETWSPGTPVVTIDGTINPSDVVLSLACTSGAATGTINAHWNRTRYEGTFSFNGGVSTSPVSITGWSGQAPMPTARFGVGAASANGQVYAIGGVGGSCDGVGPCIFGPLTTVESYDPVANTWSPAPSLSVGRESAGVATIGNTIYVVGGHVPGGEASGVVEVFNGSSWTTLPQSDWMPTARAGLGLVTDGTYLYAIGGSTQAGNAGHVATVERFDPSAAPGSRWTTLTPMPAAGSVSGAGVLNGNIVVAGSDGTNRTDIYDIASGVWHIGPPMPAQRGSMASGVSHGGLWLVGGTSNGSLAYDPWVYFPASANRAEGWGGVGSMSTGRWALGAAVVDDVVYAVGGAASSSGAFLGLSTNESLSTPPFEDLATNQGSSSSGNPLAVQWLSTDPSVADIDGGGFAHVHALGQTTIVASVGGVSCQTTNSCAILTGGNAAPTVQITGAVTGPGPTPPFVPGPFSIGEGVQLQLNAPASDPDGDQLTYAWSLVSGSGTLNTFGPSGPSASYTNVDGPATATVQVTVTDTYGATASATASITVSNIVPTVQIFGGPFNTTESSQFQNLNTGGNFFDPGANDGPWTVTVNYGDGTGVQTLSYSPSSFGGSGAGGNFQLSHRYADNGSFTVTVEVVDKDLGKGTATATVNVANALPQVFMPMSSSTVVGSTNDFGCVSFNDQGSADAPWTATVNYGDGSGDQSVALSIPGSCGGGGTTIGRFSLNHAYTAGGSYTVTVRVTDKDLGTGQGTSTVSVNAPPVVIISPIAPANEGSLMTGGGSFTDGPTDGPWTIRVTYGDNTGQFTLPQTNPYTFSHVYRDNGSYLVTVRVTDRFFATGSTSMLVTVNNVAPTVTLPLSAGPIVEGQQVFVSASFFDPGQNDAQSPGFSATVDYGDGSPIENRSNLGFNSSSGTGNFSFNHTYVDNPASPATTFTITVTVRDKDGSASVPKTVPVTVLNTVPGVSITQFPGQVRQGIPATFSGLISDQGANDAPWTGMADFGDGSPLQPLTITPGVPPGSFMGARATFTLTHTYAQSGNFELTLTATDKDGGTTSVLPWTTMAPDPHAKYTPVAVAINGRLYVHGFDQDPAGNQSSFVARLGIYAPSSNTWSNGAAPNLIRSYSSVGAINGKMYVVGGCILSDCSFPTNELRIYDTFSNQWSTGAPMPTVRFGAAAGVINGKLYVTGGTLAGYVSTNVTEIYDPAVNSWTTGTPIPVARELAMSAVSNNELYVIGGYERGAVNGPVGRVDVFNPSTGWSTRSPMPTARSAGIAAAIDGWIYVAGGAAAGGVFLNSNERYDPFSDTWTAEAPMPTARVYGSGGAVNSKLYVIDGYNGGPLSTNEAFNPNTSFSIRVRPVLVSLAIAPVSVTLTTIGQTAQFIATATFSDGSTQSTSGDPDEGVIWTSSNPGVATIVPGGLATAVGPGATIISADAEDDGNFFHAEALLSVDSVPPVITANDVSAEATSAAGATVSFAFSAVDDLDPNPTVTADHVSGATYPIGTTNVLITATDAAGNSSTKTLHVVVVDTTPPTITAPAALVVSTDAGAATAVVADAGLIAVASDNAGPVTVVRSGVPAGNLFPMGTTVVTYTATDASGNTATATQTVTVLDTERPTLQLPGNITVDATGPAGAVVTYIASATDAVNGPLPVGCSKVSGSTFSIGTTTVTCTAADAAGNTASGSFTVLVQAAAAQVANLAVVVQNFNLVEGIANGLDAKLQNILSALDAAQSGSVANVCGKVGAFINETQAQSGKKLTVDQANQLILAATRIKAVVGCQ